MSRRGRGEGTIFQRTNGTWVARIELPIGPDGKRKQRSKRAKTRKEARAKLKQLLEELEELDNPYGGERTVANAVASFLEIQVFKSKGTRVRAEWQANIVTSGLGPISIGDLTVYQCDQFLEQAANGKFGQQPLTIDSLRRVRSTLNNALRNEVRVGNLARNVAEVSVLPAHIFTTDDPDDYDESDEDDGEFRRALTHDEFQQLRTSAKQPLTVIIDLCGRNGLRPSEARALRWNCIDFDNRTIRINRQMSSTNKLTKTKTKRANRLITLDEITTQVLLTWKDQQDRHKDKAGNRWQTKPNLIITTRYGTSIDASNLRRSVTSACKNAGIERIVPYELRHTAISHQADAGHSAAAVSDWAGTSVRMIDDIYRHRIHQVAQIKPIVLNNYRNL